MIIDMLKAIKEFDWHLRGYFAFFVLGFSIVGFFLTAMAIVALIVAGIS